MKIWEFLKSIFGAAKPNKEEIKPVLEKAKEVLESKVQEVKKEVEEKVQEVKKETVKDIKSKVSKPKVLTSEDSAPKKVIKKRQIKKKKED